MNYRQKDLLPDFHEMSKKENNIDALNKYFPKFSLLRKTKRALQDFLNDDLYLLEKWSVILKEYTPKIAKKQNKISWKDLADRVYSEYIRLSECDEK